MMSILTALGLGMSSCAQHENITSVDVDQFETSIMSDNVQLVDVRTAEEYAEGHIAYAANIDIQKANFKDKAQTMLDKESPAYVYCRSGHRSMMAAKELAKMGFKVVNLSGGVMEWTNKGKPLNK
ncbi:MAG: rhodanese-like domain-containing protein [Prevotella sp.]